MTTLPLDNGADRVVREHPGVLSLAFCAAWTLGLLTFSLPGRTVPDTLNTMDWVAEAKTAARVVVILGGVAVVLWYPDRPRRRLVFHALFPLAVFLGWAILSAAWSPMKAVSLGQAGSLTAQLLIVAVIGLTVTDESCTERVLFQLNAMLLVVAMIVVGTHLVSPESSGLARDFSDEGSIGFVHPTSAGATASLGIVLLLLTKLIWNPRWLWWLLVPGLVVHPVLLILAASRTAIGMAGAVLVVAVPVLIRRARVAALVLLTCTIGAFYLCLDPGLELVDGGLHSAAKYMMRRESTEEIHSLTGRTELWAAVWGEFCKSPLQGCGYFVTSQNGLLDVWAGPGNRTAHNVLLQVLSSTGLIGLAMFLWGLLWVSLRSGRALAQSEAGRRLGVFLLFVAVWYLGWGQLCSSFMGPIQPESIVFFCCLGLAVSGLQRSDAPKLAPPQRVPRFGSLGGTP